MNLDKELNELRYSIAKLEAPTDLMKEMLANVEGIHPDILRDITIMDLESGADEMYNPPEVPDEDYFNERGEKI